MHISKDQSKREDWDKVISWNYQLPNLNPKMSLVYAEVEGEHGEVTTGESEWIYYIINGEGEFVIGNNKTAVKAGDVVTVPAKTLYNYKSSGNSVLKVVMYIDMWEN